MSFVQLVESLKKTKEDIYISVLDDGIEIPFVLPSHKEAIKLATMLKICGSNLAIQDLIFEYIFNTYTLDTYLINNNNLYPAGIISSIAGIILHLSMVLSPSLEDINNYLNQYREVNDNYLSEFYRTICSVFPSYKFSDLDKLNYQELLSLFTNAERVMLDRGIITEVTNIKAKEQTKAESIEAQIKKDLKEFTKFQNS